MRKKIFEIIEVAEEGNLLSFIYDIFMIITICISIFILMLKDIPKALNVIDIITVVIFIIDYILRLVTADYKLNKGKKSFLLYPFSGLAIVDLLSILPSLLMILPAFKLFKLFRLLKIIKTFKVLRVFKITRYSKNAQIILNVFKHQKDLLTTVAVFAAGYILISALIIFNIEPDTFNNFFDAIYWATVSLTTVGYGDIYPVSSIGRIITMVSSLFGIAIIAVPGGIITAGYMEELQKDSD